MKNSKPDLPPLRQEEPAPGLPVYGYFEEKILQAQEDSRQQQAQLSRQQEEKTALQEQKTRQALQELSQELSRQQDQAQQQQDQAYARHRRQADPYGAQAEALAAQGLSRSGYSRALEQQSYHRYRQAVTEAETALELAAQAYHREVAQARQLNSAALARIALETLQEQAKLALQAEKTLQQLRRQQQQALQTEPIPVEGEPGADPVRAVEKSDSRPARWP